MVNESKKTFSRAKPKGGGGIRKVIGSLFGLGLIAVIFLYVLSPAFNVGDAVRNISNFGTDIGHVIASWIGSIFSHVPAVVTPSGTATP